MSYTLFKDLNSDDNRINARSHSVHVYGCVIGLVLSVDVASFYSLQKRNIRVFTSYFYFLLCNTSHSTTGFACRIYVQYLRLSQARIKEEGSAVGLRPTRVKNFEQQKQCRILGMLFA